MPSLPPVPLIAMPPLLSCCTHRQTPPMPPPQPPQSSLVNCQGRQWGHTLALLCLTPSMDPQIPSQQLPAGLSPLAASHTAFNTSCIIVWETLGLRTKSQAGTRTHSVPLAHLRVHCRTQMMGLITPLLPFQDSPVLPTGHPVSCIDREGHQC